MDGLKVTLGLCAHLSAESAIFYHQKVILLHDLLQLLSEIMRRVSLRVHHRHQRFLVILDHLRKLPSHYLFRHEIQRLSDSRR